jgi:hypothetical protein
MAVELARLPPALGLGLLALRLAAPEFHPVLLGVGLGLLAAPGLPRAVQIDQVGYGFPPRGVAETLEPPAPGAVCGF